MTRARGRTMVPEGGPVLGDDGRLRCPWGAGPDDYRAYHDAEWGREVRGDHAIFERLSLEAFQAGLSWLTILRRRDGFREAFANFDARVVASYDESMIDRLVTDSRIIRHRGKIQAVVSNAQTLCRWQDHDGDGVLEDLLWSSVKPIRGSAPTTIADVPTQTSESELITRRLRERGWRFIGPTSAYAAMQAMGVVNDHLVGCHAR
jgi:DNA-3-methyladenine glycosylase I